MSTSVIRFVYRHGSKLALAATVAALGLAWYGGVVSADEPLAREVPAPVVEYTTMQLLEIRDWSTYSGRLAAVESAAIKPLVGGTIVQVLFSEGQQVAAGDPLFVIDPRPHQIAAEHAEAALATARSRLQLARDEFARAERLHGKDLVSDSVFDTARSNLQVADASVLQAKSALAQAQLNLEYAHVKAPIGGRVSRAELTVGNVVEAGPNAPVLTTIVAADKLYAEFNVDEQSYVQFARNQQHQQSMPVELSLAQDSSTVYDGYIQAFDNHLDSSSGTIRARALVENVDGVLTPGLYVNVRMGSAQKKAMLLVPERAISTNQSRKFVYVVDAANTIQYREVSLGANYQGHRVVLDGLAVGDQVVVNGLSHIGPNMQVNPLPLAGAELVVSR